MRREEDRHRLSIFDAIDRAADRQLELALHGVDHTVDGDRVDGDRGCRVDHEAPGGLHRVTGKVAHRGEHRVASVTQRRNLCRGNRQGPRIGQDRSGIAVIFEQHAHHAAVFDPRGVAGNRHRAGVITRVDDVVAHDRIERQRGGCIDVQTARDARRVPCGILRSGRNGKGPVIQRRHFGARHRHGPGTARHLGEIGLTVEGYGDRATLFDTDGRTADRQGQKTLDRVDHVARVYLANRQRRGRVDLQRGVRDGDVGGAITDHRMNDVGTIRDRRNGARGH